VRLQPKTLLAGVLAFFALLVCVPSTPRGRAPINTYDEGAETAELLEDVSEALDVWNELGATPGRTVPQERPGALPRLRGVLRVGDERVAFLGGRLVRVGDVLPGSLTVESIEDGRVLLRGPSGPVALGLPWFLARGRSEHGAPDPDPPGRREIEGDLEGLLELVGPDGPTSSEPAPRENER
jgi:hypothetical protein